MTHFHVTAVSENMPFYEVGRFYRAMHSTERSLS